MARIESASLGFNAQAARLTGLLIRQPLWILLPAGVVAIAVMILWHTPPEREVLLSGQRFRAEELAAIEAAFARAGLQQYEINDEVVSVPRREKTAYMRALEQADVLPRALSAALQEAIYSSHPFESPAQRQARWKFAGEQELASYLRALDDIDDATVRFDEVRHDGLQPSHAIRAMVVLKPTRGTVLVPERLQSVCELVAASRVGMSPSDVTVLDLGSGQTFTSGAAWTAAQRQEQFARRKLTYEAHWNKKLAELLTFVPRVSVATDVQLSDDSLGPLGMHVVVTVPDTYYLAVWQDQLRCADQPLRAPTSTELQQVHREVDAGLEEIVGQLFPSDPAGQPVATVAIASVPDVPPTTSERVPRWNTRPSMVVSIILLLVVGCALVLAGFIRDLVSQATPVLASDTGAPGASFHKPTAASFTESATRSQGAPSEREELVRLVRTNPAAAAATLRSWVEPTS